MISGKKCFLTSLCALLIASTAFAADKASRPAAKSDLIGVWEMVSVKPVYEKADPVFFPYQRIEFNKDSSMKSMTSEKPFTKDIAARVKAVDRVIDAAAGTFGLVAEIANANDELPAGIRCKLSLPEVR